MKNEKNLREKNIKKLFWQYAIPSVGMMIVMSVYFMVDSVFIGRGIGSDALAGLYLTIPFLMIGTTFTMSLAIGASIVISIYLSNKKYHEASNIFSTLFFINVLIALFFILLAFFFSDNIAALLGANEVTTPYVVNYLSIALYFMMFFSLQSTFASTIRNDGNPNLALVASIGGSLINIPLDAIFIFVFKWGIRGAAFATGLSQVVACSILLLHFLLKKGHLKFIIPKVKIDQVKRMFFNAVPIMVGNMFMPISMFIMNNNASYAYGTLGVSAFAIIGNITMFIMVTLNGISLGMQPIISFNHGCDLRDRVKQTFHYALKNSLIISVTIILLVYVFADSLVGLYIADSSAVELTLLAKKGLRMYLFGFVFLTVNLILASYFQSIEQLKKANTINMLRSLLVLIPISILVPLFFPSAFIWWILLFSEFITMLVFIGFYRNNKAYSA